jgi:hypothetical protein
MATQSVADRKLDSQGFSSAKSSRSSRSGFSTRAPSESEQNEAEELQALRVVNTDSEDQEVHVLDTHEEDEFPDTDSELTPRNDSKRHVAQRFEWPWQGMDPAAASWQTCAEVQKYLDSCWQLVYSTAALAAAPRSCSNDGGFGAMRATPCTTLAYCSSAVARVPATPGSLDAPASGPGPGCGWGFGKLSCQGAADEPFERPRSVRGPEVTTYHRLHDELRGMGQLSPDRRDFVKTKFEKRLSVLTESHVRTGGKHRYLIQFTGGDISNADGVGFIFSNKLPCPKNIQMITSVFVNRMGRICMRSGKDVVGANRNVRPFEVGDHIELRVDLEELVATFSVWRSGRAPSVASFDFGAGFARLGTAAVPSQSGYFAAVVQNIGVSIALRS